MKLHDVFKPAKRGDKARSINLFPDAITVFFERNERGVKTEYVKVAHPSVVPQLRVRWTTGVTRILFYRASALLVALTTGRKVCLEPWITNNSENLDRLHLNQESLSIYVEGFESFSLDRLTDLTSGNFEFFGPEVKGRWNGGTTQTAQQWETINQYRYCDTQVAGYYPPVEAPKVEVQQ